MIVGIFVMKRNFPKNIYHSLVLSISVSSRTEDFESRELTNSFYHFCFGKYADFVNYLSQQ